MRWMRRARQARWTQRAGWAVVALVLVLLLGCSATPPPKELVDARASYGKAEKGLAARLAPADLDTAKKALDQAEAAFADDPSAELSRDLAYVADRKARLAEANAAIERAARVRSGAEEQYKEATEAELAKARKELEAGQRALQAERAARTALERKLKLALESLAEVAAVKEEARGVVITLSGAVLFASGKSQLLPIARDKLDQVATALDAQGQPTLLVEGHTDGSGPRTGNMLLSQARADAVRAHLVAKGYPVARITAVGVGPDRPVADNTSAEGRANNRRVEIVVGK